MISGDVILYVENPKDFSKVFLISVKFGIILIHHIYLKIALIHKIAVTKRAQDCVDICPVTRFRKNDPQ